MTAALTGMFALTPVGDSAAASCAAIRARVSGLFEHPWLTALGPDPDWDPPERLRAGRVPTIDEFEAGRERLLILALEALSGIVASARIRRAELARTALLLSLPEPEPAVEAMDMASFGAELLSRAGVEGVGPTRAARSGRPGALELVGYADTLLASGAADAAVIVAVDSLLDGPRIAGWDAARRLRTSRCKDGILPGEASVSLLLEPWPARARRPDEPGNRPPLALLEAPAAGAEPQPIASMRASTGAGMSDAVRSVLSRPGAAPTAAWVLSDMTGEGYGAFEWGIVRVRLGAAIGGARLDHPADAIGDVGAAASAILVACAAHGFAREPSAPSAALLISASDGPRRVALVARRPPSP